MSRIRIFLPPNGLWLPLQRTRGHRGSQWYFRSKCSGDDQDSVELKEQGPETRKFAEMGHFDQVGVPLRREAGIVDVARLKNTLWEATLGYADHGTAQELGSRDVSRKQPSQEWQQRLCHGVEDAVAGRS
jgi:hypothetical protein